MKEPPRQAEPSLRQIEHDPGDMFAERHSYIPSNTDNNRSYFEDSPRNLESSHGYRESCGQHYGTANDLSQSHTPNIGFGAEDFNSYDPCASMQTTGNIYSDNNLRLQRGVENYVEMTSPNYRKGEVRTKDSPSAYSMHHRSSSAEVPSLAPMPLSRNSSAPPQAAGQHYGPFRGYFQNSEEAKEYRRKKMRFNREPWREPANDPTIEHVERNRNINVERIYNAMICGDYARDNAGSTALKRWVEEPHYQSDLVEAYAHKVFDCLIEQVKMGFRGWQQNDYVNDERKGEDEDKDTNCAGRLDNIVEALRLEKTICENVMCSAWQIRMFVNAPKAYSKRKDQNRVGNSKRPNAKGSCVVGDHLRASKRSRTVAASRRRHTRNHSSAASETQLSLDTTPQQAFESSGLPYLTSQTMHRVALSPPPTFLAPQAPSMHPSPRSLHAHNTSAALPSTPPLRVQPYNYHSQHISRRLSVSPGQQSPVLPPSQPLNRSIVSVSPDDTKPTNMNMTSCLRPWNHGISPGLAPPSNFAYADQTGISEFPGIEHWQHNVQPFSTEDALSNANLFAQHPEMGVCLADMELSPTYAVGDAAGEDVFSFWQHQDDVQKMTNAPSHRQNQS
ncbi:hypothetical protein J4E82_003968 [Alternaria postmessia]|uniref:uncharacterized protein n=1 Tax=Alternaria postmessia TaxID=1187938 RepID=UPI002224135B|nr:uncharacterized protein J4E82_003968 [Alternaria postmessia]KAI5377176.1 hypothetical protein J4E82_003968 [Alternaria postmessia]